MQTIFKLRPVLAQPKLAQHTETVHRKEIWGEGRAFPRHF
jgi:hypothetical protein